MLQYYPLFNTNKFKALQIFFSLEMIPNNMKNWVFDIWLTFTRQTIYIFHNSSKLPLGITLFFLLFNTFFRFIYLETTHLDLWFPCFDYHDTHSLSKSIIWLETCFYKLVSFFVLCSLWLKHKHIRRWLFRFSKILFTKFCEFKRN